MVKTSDTMTYAYTRPAFTMLELIFAIVIIAIGVLALPTVLSTSVTSQEQTLKEEGIMLTVSKISQILTYAWDDNSPSPLGIMSNTQVLNVTNGDNELDRNTTDFRRGHFPGVELRRRMTPASAQRNATATPFANDSADPESISDFNAEIISDANSTGIRTYKKTYRVSTTVGYVADTATYSDTNLSYNFPTATLGAGQTSNIKVITVTTDEQVNGAWEPIIVLRSYSANIGEAEFFKRRY